MTITATTGYADLHAHTTASDGTLTPTELVQAANAAGLSLLAVTDHDTVAGVGEARAAAEAAGIGLVPGVELSADGAPGKCHLLGLGIDPNHAGLRETLARVSEARRTRNERIAERLLALGAPITLDEVVTVAPPGANVGRPHFAQALLAKNIVRTRDEAFDRFLGDTAPAYVPASSLTPGEAIALIRQGGGLAFLAHPALVKLAPGETMRARLEALKALGLDGIEAYYGQHTLAQIEQFLSLARGLDLLVTGGSDFHGAHKPDVFLGDVFGGRGVPLSVLPPQLTGAAGRKEPCPDGASRAPSPN